MFAVASIAALGFVVSPPGRSSSPAFHQSAFRMMAPPQVEEKGNRWDKALGGGNKMARMVKQAPKVKPQKMPAEGAF